MFGELVITQVGYWGVGLLVPVILMFLLACLVGLLLVDTACLGFFLFSSCCVSLAICSKMSSTVLN